MRPAIPWLAVPLLALLLPGMPPSASVPDALAQVVSPELADTPTQCLAERNHGACVECCKLATDCDSGATFPCNACAKFCRNNIPPPPAPEEPAP